MKSVDLESYSEVDIQACGLYVYAEHPSTDILCAVFDDEPWTPGMPKPAAVVRYIQEGGTFAAFNAAFERTMWQRVMVEKYDWPSIELERWYCTAAQAAASGLPGGLDKCANFLMLDAHKNEVGRKLMLTLSKPDAKGKRPSPTTEQLIQLIEYCLDDTIVERQLRNTLPPLSPDEREVWLLDQKLNDRGLYVDTDFARAANEFWEEYLEKINTRVRELTGGINGTQVGALTQWVIQQGVRCNTLAKASLQALLTTALPDNVREVLELRLEAGTTAVKKYPKFIECACRDSRVRGTHRYHGASTGRWAGNLIQPHNFPRGILKADEVPLAQKLVREKRADLIDMIWSDPGKAGQLRVNVGTVLGSLCRSTIVAAPGSKLVACDYSQVEARGIAWFAEEQAMLKAFRNNEDAYRLMAGRIFGCSPAAATDEQRFLGKSAVLGCGYQMGPDKFKRSLQELWNVSIPHALAKKCVYGYRDANPATVRFWGQLEGAVRMAIEGTNCKYGRLRFSREKDWLYVTLPSGRRIAYYEPEVHPSHGILVTGPDKSGKPFRESLYGGKLAENIVSGFCRDLLVHAIQGLESASYTIVGTVHDEIISETPDDSLWSLGEMQQIMLELPVWAPGFPVAASGWEGYFYRK